MAKNGDAHLHVHVQPGAKNTELVGLHGERLKVRLKAPPVDGKANKELVKWAAAYFGVGKSRITLIRGLSSRQKTLQIEGLEV
ncbi:MAG TPA: YggU family protein [Myxococcales bacterium]|nr:YggU family protein [Myxococcales bacterium]